MIELSSQVYRLLTDECFVKARFQYRLLYSLSHNLIYCEQFIINLNEIDKLQVRHIR